ncbi:MAG TPA: PD-(D/E)XK nuclease family protein [Vicinamibacteria bacterium]
MGIRPVVLLVPSVAAAVELPRRLASAGPGLTGLYPFKVLDLARAVAEPALLGRGLEAWHPGHDALLAARLLDEEPSPLVPADVPRAPVAAALARTLSALRMGGVEAKHLEAAAGSAETDDARRLLSLAHLYRRFLSEVDGRLADPATLLHAARENLEAARWLEGAEVLIAGDLELDLREREFVAALARVRPVRLIAGERPAGLGASSFAAWAAAHGIAEAPLEQTVLAALAPPAPPSSLRRLRTCLFEPPQGPAVHDGAVELLTAPGEAAEVRAIVRRLLREAARGVPFEEMGVILPRPEDYAPLVTDLLERLAVPHRLHPSLPLRCGRSARSLLLLFRCRGLPRRAVMEFLTFAPVPFERLLGDGEQMRARPSRWDAISRDAGIVSGLDRWRVGLRAHAQAERAAATDEPAADRAERRRRGAAEAEALLAVVEALAQTLDGLAGESSWPEWSRRLEAVFDTWVDRERDRDAVAEVLADLAGLASVSPRAGWREVEAVLEARFEWERLPVGPLSSGGIHVGALDAMAGLPFRVVAIPGLVEGGYPGVLRPDPFLLDAEREALAARATSPLRRAAARARGQLSLFDQEEDAPPAAAAPERLATTQDRLLEARRMFHRALGQATERLILSYPRADPRNGRERLPSLFLVAAASALEGRPVGTIDLDALVGEDDLDALPLEDALDASERDRIRVRRGGDEAAEAIAGGSPSFRGARRALKARWSNRLTAYDGLVAYPAEHPEAARFAAEVRPRLDPTSSDWPLSASRLATFAQCGFRYLLQHVIGLDAVLEPEERRRLEPLERGSLFHAVAERFLRERRDKAELPVRDIPEMRRRLMEMADEALDSLVAGSPPRFTLLWERERSRFRDGLTSWLEREAGGAHRAVPAHFEVAFGLAREVGSAEPHMAEPLLVDLGDGRTLRVSGRIDRIDRRPDGTLVLRDYKTGRAPRDDGGLFRGGRQLQIPFYVLAAARIFPGQPVVEAFLDFVDGGRQVSFDPERVQGREFRELLRGLVDAIAEGSFVQEPTACDWCDFTAVCGPKGLIDARRRHKLADLRIQRVLRLRDVV